MGLIQVSVLSTGRSLSTVALSKPNCTHQIAHQCDYFWKRQLCWDMTLVTCFCSQPCAGTRSCASGHQPGHGTGLSNTFFPPPYPPKQALQSEEGQKQSLNLTFSINVISSQASDGHNKKLGQTSAWVNSNSYSFSHDHECKKQQFSTEEVLIRI